MDKRKEINETMGHTEGDNALRQKIHFWQKILGNSDSIGRFGGDEFMFFTQCISAKLIEKRIEAFNIMLSNGGEIFKSSVSCSFGVYLSTDNSIPAEELMLHADFAMYEAKRSGRARYVIKYDDGEH